MGGAPPQGTDRVFVGYAFALETLANARRRDEAGDIGSAADHRHGGLVPLGSGSTEPCLLDDADSFDALMDACHAMRATSASSTTAARGRRGFVPRAATEQLRLQPVKRLENRRRGSPSSPHGPLPARGAAAKFWLWPVKSE